MFIGKFENAYGEEFWGEGETIEDALNALEGITGDPLHADAVTWFEANPVKVTCKTDYFVQGL